MFYLAQHTIVPIHSSHNSSPSSQKFPQSFFRLHLCIMIKKTIRSAFVCTNSKFTIMYKKMKSPEPAGKKTFSRRKFVSVGLFFTLTVLVITAIVIQIFEAIEDDFFIHCFTVAHIFTGLAFTVLSVLHAKMNWQSMKSYMRTKRLAVSSEVVCAFLLTMGAIFSGFLFVYIFIR